MSQDKTLLRFRVRKDLLERLELEAKKDNRPSVGNYIETKLLEMFPDLNAPVQQYRHPMPIPQPWQEPENGEIL